MTSKKRGNSWEHIITQENGLLLQEGQALVHQVPDNVHIIQRLGNSGEVRGRLKYSTLTDFAGILYGGRGVAFDAKRTSTSTRFSFAMLDERQVRWMRDYTRLGGIGFVYLLVDPKDERPRRYVLPVDRYASVAGWPYFGGGRASVPLVHGTGHHITSPDGHPMSFDPRIFEARGDQTWFDVMFRLLEGGWWTPED